MLTKATRLRQAAWFSLMAAAASLAFSITLYEASSILFIVLSLAVMVLERDFSVFRKTLTIFIGLFCAVTLISVSQSGYLWDSWKGVFRVVRCALLCLSVIVILDDEKKWRATFWVVVSVAVIVVLDGLFQGLFGFEPLRQREMTAYTAEIQRVTATFRHANNFAAYLCLAIFYMIGGTLAKYRSRASLTLLASLGLAVLLAGSCLIWTLSRGAWMGVFAATLLLGICKKQKFLLALLIAGVVWAMYFSPTLIRNRVQDLSNMKAGTVHERTILAQESMAMINASPWLGLGINTFSKNAPRFKLKDHLTDVQYAHNGYLQMAVETGWIGLVSFLLLIGYFFWSLRTFIFNSNHGFLDTTASCIVFGILAFLIHSATDTNLHSLLLVSNLWFSMGLAWAAWEIRSRR